MTDGLRLVFGARRPDREWLTYSYDPSSAPAGKVDLICACEADHGDPA
jgi:hypothetical protein